MLRALTLETPRLLLRALRDDDAPALLGIFGNAQVMRYWSTPPWTSIEQALAFVTNSHEGFADCDALRLGIVRRADDQLIGQCTLFDIAGSSRRAEMGYSLAHAAWGHGFMDEALRALLGHGFGALDLNRVEADIDPRNSASARSLERLGFQKEGLLRERWVVAGEASDTALYGLLRREWIERNPESAAAP